MPIVLVNLNSEFSWKHHSLPASGLKYSVAFLVSCSAGNIFSCCLSLYEKTILYGVIPFGPVTFKCFPEKRKCIFNRQKQIEHFSAVDRG